MPTATAKLIVSPFNGYPGFKVNSTYYPPTYFEKGSSIITFEYNYGENVIFKLTNKDPDDTKIVDDEIVEDKYIILEHILLEYTEIREVHFHQFFFDPFFGVNEEEKILHIPTLDKFPIWALKLHVT